MAVARFILARGPTHGGSASWGSTIHAPWGWRGAKRSLLFGAFWALPECVMPGDSCLVPSSKWFCLSILSHIPEDRPLAVLGPVVISCYVKFMVNVPPLNCSYEPGGGGNDVSFSSRDGPLSVHAILTEGNPYFTFDRDTPAESGRKERCGTQQTIVPLP